MHPNEFRRAPRFKVSLHVQITGIDTEPVVRRGDISAGGLYLESDRDVGNVGSMQRLTLTTVDRASSVVVLGRVVRVATIEDFWRGRTVVGVAFQFMFVEEMGASPLRNTARPVHESPSFQAFMRALVQGSTSARGVALQGVRGTVHTSHGAQSAALNDLNLRGMVLDTDYPLAHGERIRIELPGRSHDERWAFDGEVLDCVEQHDGDHHARFRTLVRFSADAAETSSVAGGGETLDQALEALLDAFTSLAPPALRDRRAGHLAGELTRISLASVLTLCQIERVTGVLRLESEGGKVSCYLREGELVDVVLEGRDVPPRTALSEVLCWQEGTFEVSFEPVLRPDRIGMPTTPLLIDLTREIDEARR